MAKSGRFSSLMCRLVRLKENRFSRRFSPQKSENLLFCVCRRKTLWDTNEKWENSMSAGKIEIFASWKIASAHQSFLFTCCEKILHSRASCSISNPATQFSLVSQTKNNEQTWRHGMAAQTGTTESSHFTTGATAGGAEVVPVLLWCELSNFFLIQGKGGKSRWISWPQAWRCDRHHQPARHQRDDFAGGECDAWTEPTE